MADVTHGGDPVGGDTAHAAADSGRPVKIGGKANQNEPTAVADGQRTDAWFDQQGRLVVAPLFPGNVASAGVHGPVSVTLTTTSEATVIAAPGAGSIYVTGIMASNTSGTKSRLDLKEGAAGTVRISMMCASDGGGFISPSLTPPWKLPATTALIGQLDTAVTDVRVNIQFFVAP
jgi:hypothetical protein